MSWDILLLTAVVEGVLFAGWHFSRLAETEPRVAQLLQRARPAPARARKPRSETVPIYEIPLRNPCTSGFHLTPAVSPHFHGQLRSGPASVKAL